MNVGQLIKALQKHPSDALAVVNGYEGGVDEVEVCKLVEIELNVHTEGYFGSHEIRLAGDALVLGHICVPAIQINS